MEYMNQLRERIEQNYEDFREEMLQNEPEDIFEDARKIAATQDVHHFITTQSYWADDGEAAYLLEFSDPLRMLADAWLAYMDDAEGDFRMIVEEVLDRNDNTQNYMTIGLESKLRQKYGSDTHIKDALFAEVMATGEEFMRLKNLLDEDFVDSLDDADFEGYYCDFDDEDDD